jgi:hypothetical protein
MQGQDAGGGLGLLVGAPGQEFVASMLSTKDPQSAVNEVQKAASLPERCMPLLQLLDQLGVARAESHQYILQYARRILLSRIDKMSPDKLNLLLEVCSHLLLYLIYFHKFQIRPRVMLVS